MEIELANIYDTPLNLRTTEIERANIYDTPLNLILRLN